MPFDALTISAVRDELLDKLVEGRVQNVIMPSPLSVSLEIYRAGMGRTHLLLSAHPQHPRIHLLGSAPSRDPAQHSPLLLLLRKYVRGGTIVGISQPRWERVLTLSIAKRIPLHKHQEYRSGWDFRHTPQEGDEEETEVEDINAPIVRVELVAEIMGKVSNIILVAEDGAVIDSVKRVPSSINRYRVTLPHHLYVAPPPQAKRDPLHTTINAMALEIERAAEAESTPAWKGLVGGYAAVSPTLAREVVFRALGDVGAKAAEVWNQPQQLGAILRELQALLRLEETGKWEPTLALKGAAEERTAVDFAPYPLTHLAAQDGELAEYASISEAATVFFEQAGSLGRHSALKAIVAARLAEIRGRDERKLSALREEWNRAQSMEELRRKGELLLAYMHTLKPGQTSLVIPEEKLTIELDPAMTPVENAQAIFREYRKAQSAIEGLPERMAESELRVAYWNDLGTSLEIANNYDDIKSVQAEIDGAGRPQAQGQEQNNKGDKKRKPSKLPQPLRMQTKRGVGILLGRTAGQNDTATFRLASPEDLWFHTRNAPGAHVILRAAPQLSEEDVEDAARLAAGYSKLRGDAQVDVIYTEKRYVRKIPNAPPGQVTYRNEKVIRVAPGATGAGSNGKLLTTGGHR